MKSNNLHVVQRRSWLWWLAPVAWAAALYVASSVPGTSYPEVSFVAADKLVHVGIYGVLGALIAQAARSNLAWSDLRLWLFALSGAVVYGASDELHQVFVPNRSADLRDLLADAIGAGLGAWLVLAISSWRRRRRAQRV